MISIVCCLQLDLESVAAKKLILIIWRKASLNKLAMPCSSSSNDDDSYLFIGRTDKIALLLRALHSINAKSDGTIVVSKLGVKIVVEEAGVMQSAVLIDVKTFHDYRLRDDDKDEKDENRFGISLAHLLACLSVHTRFTAAVKMGYRGNGFPLELLIQQNNVVTDCNLKTSTAAPLTNFFINPDAYNRMTTTTDYFRLVTQGLDMSSELVTFSLSTSRPKFSLSTNGSAGEAVHEVDDENAFFRSIDCPLNLKAVYRQCHLKIAFKPISLFPFVCIRMDDSGLLHLMYFHENPEHKHLIAEFYIAPHVSS